MKPKKLTLDGAFENLMNSCDGYSGCKELDLIRSNGYEIHMFCGPGKFVIVAKKAEPKSSLATLDNITRGSD